MKKKEKEKQKQEVILIGEEHQDGSHMQQVTLLIKKPTDYLKISILEQVQFVKRLFYIYA